MQNYQVIAPTTSAVSANAIDAQTAANCVNTMNYPSVTVTADALGSGETVTIYLLVGGSTFKKLTDSAGNVQQLKGGADGTAIPALQLVGGNVYGFAKDATASACGVYVDFIGRYS